MIQTETLPLKNDIKIAIAVNKRDLWFCRICVASIRYYYPDIGIFLLKDEMNGVFSTTELETYFGVQTINFNRKKFGWSAAKMHLYTDERFKGQRFLVLDADIVFTGKVLNDRFSHDQPFDILVDEEKVDTPYAEWFKKTYFDIDILSKQFPGYQYPGYSFNCGQLFCRIGFINKEDVQEFFDFEQQPSWKRLDIFPLIDQSLLNWLVPKLEQEGTLRVGKASYMWWSENPTTKNFVFDVANKENAHPFLIHWAGARRIPYLSKMSRPDLLKFFENEYYNRIPFGKWHQYARKIKPVALFYFRWAYQRFKKMKETKL